VPSNTACIFMSNHLSNLDPPLCCRRFRGVPRIFKQSLMKIPALGYAMRLPGCACQRDGSAQGAQESVAAARKVLESGVHITTFVEGTRSKTAVAAFKKARSTSRCRPARLHSRLAMGTEG